MINNLRHAALRLNGGLSAALQTAALEGHLVAAGLPCPSGQGLEELRTQVAIHVKSRNRSLPALPSEQDQEPPSKRQRMEVVASALNEIMNELFNRVDRPLSWKLSSSANVADVKVTTRAVIECENTMFCLTTSKIKDDKDHSSVFRSTAAFDSQTGVLVVRCCSDVGSHKTRNIKLEVGHAVTLCAALGLKPAEHAPQGQNNEDKTLSVFEILRQFMLTYSNAHKLRKAFGKSEYILRPISGMPACYEHWLKYENFLNYIFSVNNNDYPGSADELAFCSKLYRSNVRYHTDLYKYLKCIDCDKDLFTVRRAPNKYGFPNGVYDTAAMTFTPPDPAGDYSYVCSNHFPQPFDASFLELPDAEFHRIPTPLYDSILTYQTRPNYSTFVAQLAREDEQDDLDMSLPEGVTADFRHREKLTDEFTREQREEATATVRKQAKDPNLEPSSGAVLAMARFRKLDDTYTPSTDDKYQWHFVMRGRQLQPVQTDNWQCCYFIYGVSNCGKSTELNVFSRFFATEDVAVLSANMEQTFGYENLDTKRLFKCPDAPAMLSAVLPETMFNSIVTGEPVNLPGKNTPANQIAQRVGCHLTGAGNNKPNYSSFQSIRRLALLQMERTVVEKDACMEDRIMEEELPALLVKMVKAYRWGLAKVGNVAFAEWGQKGITDCYAKEQAKMTRDNDPVAKFLLLKEGDHTKDDISTFCVIFDSGHPPQGCNNLGTRLSVLKANVTQYAKTHLNIKNYTWNDAADQTLERHQLLVQKLRQCQECMNKAEVGCCKTRAETKRLTQKDRRGKQSEYVTNLHIVTSNRSLSSLSP